MLHTMTKLHMCTGRTTVRPARSVVVRASEPTPESTIVGSSGEEYARTLPGISGPMGYFDPLSLAEATDPDQVKVYREAELTHGRVCMLAVVGFLVGEAVEDKTLFYNWDGGISGPAILHFQQTKPGFWEPLVLCIGICESYRVAIGWGEPRGDTFGKLKEEYTPGDLGFDPLGLKPKDPAALIELQTKELNNGRLAMITTAAYVAQELVNKKGIIENLQSF